MTADEMVGLNGHEFEQTPGGGEGQGSLACCSPWGRKESDTPERLNNYISLPSAHSARHQSCLENSVYMITTARFRLQNHCSGPEGGRLFLSGRG